VSSGRLKALFFLPSVAYFRAFESLVAQMLAGGREVLVAFERHQGPLSPGDRQALDGLREQHSGFEHVQLRSPSGMWRTLAGAASRTLDYIRFLEPEYAEAGALRAETRDRAPRAARVLLFLPPFRWAFGRRALAWILRGVEAGVPLSRDIKALVAAREPGLVLVAPPAEPSVATTDYLRPAEAAEVPWVIVVADEEDVVRVRGVAQERMVVVQAQGSNGAGAEAGPDAVEAIERAAATPVPHRNAGRIARPLLWLLSPLLALLLVLFRPRASARGAVKGLRRLAGRGRKRARGKGRHRAELAKARARAEKAEKAARTETVRREKAERAKLKAERIAATGKDGRKKRAAGGDGADAGERASDGKRASGKPSG
jgi:hypothetical protein